MEGFNNSQPNPRDKKLYLKDLVDLFSWPPGEWVKVRLLGPVTSYAETWLKIKTKTGKIVSIPKMCLDHDPATDSFTTNICPYRAAGLAFRKTYLCNAIIRDIQDNEPRNKIAPLPAEKKRKHPVVGDAYRAHLKTLGSKTWTPVRVLRLPQGLAGKLKSLVDLNKHHGKKQELSDPSFGIDLNIMFDPNAAGALKYQVQKEERTKLSEVEKHYLHYKLDVLKPETLKEAQAEWKRLKEVVISEDKEEEETKSKYYSGKKTKNLSKRKKYV
jgi:hypothetical protein